MQTPPGAESSVTFMLWLAIIASSPPVPDGKTREEWLIEKYIECRRAVEGEKSQGMMAGH